jgi:hypothetical protein
MKVYEGLRDPDEPNTAGDTIVLVNGDPLPLKPSLKDSQPLADRLRVGLFRQRALAAGAGDPARLLRRRREGRAPLPAIQRARRRAVGHRPQLEDYRRRDRRGLR